MKRILSLILIAVFFLSASAANAKSANYRIADVTIDGKSYGSAAAPSDYSLSWEVTDSGTYQSISWPLHMQITATSSDNGTVYIYWSPRDFLDVVSGTKNTQKHSDYGLDITTRTFMLRCKSAAQWADHVASNYASVLGGTAVNEYESAASPEITDLLKSIVTAAKKAAKAHFRKINGASLVGANANYANRFYSLTVQGVPYCMNIITFTSNMTLDFSNGIDSRRLKSWEIPATWIAIYPESRSMEDLRAFTCFYNNTGCNNAFMNENYALSANMRAVYLQDYSPRISTGYDDAFSDYLFDQNSYRTSDGDTVKISTAYDYVWEQNGTVYFSDNASAIPYGATRLYAQ